MNKTKPPDRTSAAARLIEAQRDLHKLMQGMAPGPARDDLMGVNRLLLDALKMLDRMPPPSRNPE